jgi:hypothetical protein
MRRRVRPPNSSLASPSSTSPLGSGTGTAPQVNSFGRRLGATQICSAITRDTGQAADWMRLSEKIFASQRRAMVGLLHQVVPGLELTGEMPTVGRCADKDLWERRLRRRLSLSEATPTAHSLCARLKRIAAVVNAPHQRCHANFVEWVGRAAEPNIPTIANWHRRA